MAEKEREKQSKGLSMSQFFGSKKNDDALATYDGFDLVFVVFMVLHGDL